jgi:predicted kinase
MADALLIGGRAGVGKTSVAWEVSSLLAAVPVPHVLIDGDFMGQAHPAPVGDPSRSEITAVNLAAVWSNFAQRGYSRLVYTNTVVVLPGSEAMFQRAMGWSVRIVRVLLTASDSVTEDRLTHRELGSGLSAELAGSRRNARRLDAEAAPDTVRVATDGRSIPDIARDVVAATDWINKIKD